MDEEPEEEPLSWQDKFFNKFSHKADQAHFVTDLLVDHVELYKTPHLRQLYSEAFKTVNA